MFILQLGNIRLRLIFAAQVFLGVLGREEDVMAELPILSVASLLRALGNERRLALMFYMLQGERPVGDFEALVGLSQSALSQYLALLHRKGLVKRRRVRQNVFYSIKDERIVALLHLLNGFYRVSAGAAEKS